MAQRILKGVSVNPGLAMGPVHVVRATPGVIPNWSLREDEVEDEVRRLHAAIHAVGESLEHQRRTVASQTNERDAEIFAVHRMILADAKALRRLEDWIRADRLNAEACVESLIRSLEKTLGALDGNNVRGYGADVSDPWRAVIGELMKSESVRFVSSGEKVVLAAAELTPYVVTCLDRSRVLAIVTETGGRFSHGAVLARSFGFPCVVGLSNLLTRLEQGLRILVDGVAGTVQLRPDPADVDAFLLRLEERSRRTQALAVHASLPAATIDGTPFAVQVNIESLRDLETFDVQCTDGIGLLRTEFLYMERSQFPSEEEQYRLYRRALASVGERSVTLRTLDIGGDKQLPYFNMPAERNPALGWRGLRVVLEWQDLLVVQLRAVLRASVEGSLQVLFPMVTSLEEVRRVYEVFKRVRRQLLDQGYEVADEVPAGIMVEVPSALITLDHIIEEVDFVSVGTNDLVQYLLAVDRDNPRVASMYDPQHPAVFRVLRDVAVLSRQAGKPCSVCGEMAGDPAVAVLLLGLGYTGVSVAPNFMPEIKAAIRHVSADEARGFAGRLDACRTAVEIRELQGEIRSLLLQRMESVAVPRKAGDPAGGRPRSPS